MRAPLRVTIFLLASLGLAAPALAAAGEESEEGAVDTEADADAGEAAVSGAGDESGEEPAEGEAGSEAPLGYARDGWYVAIAGTYALDNYAATPYSVEDSFGVNGRLGYRFLEYGALEFEYERILEFTLQNPQDGTDFQVNVFTANARGYVPLWRLGGIAERLHPYALAGIGLHQVDVDDHGAPFGKFGGGEKGAFAARFGGGIDLYLTDQLVLFQETSYVLPVERDNHEMQYVGISVGLQWRFAPEER